jgi:hypothetical protein
VGNFRVAALLALLGLVTVAPFVATDTAQPASRYSLTAALAEHRSVDIGPYRHELGVDRAEYEGRLRSDKAPGQPMLAVPAYLAARAFGAQPASHVHVHGDLGLWSETLWSAALPFAILLALMFLACARFVRRGVALTVAILFGFCTMLLPFAVNLFAHDLVAVFGFGAWLLLANDAVTARRAGLAGLLCGLAVLCEYEAAIIAVALAGYVLVRHRSQLRWLVFGALGPALVLAWYQWAAFGAPWRTPSAFFAGTIQGTSEGGYSIPTVRSLSEVLFGNRGLWIGAPIALVAIGAAVLVLTRETGRVRDHAVVGLAILGPYLVLCAGWSGFGLLEDPGPRFLIPALPFLAVPLAVMWERLRIPAVLFAIWGALFALPATVSYLLLGIHQPAFPALPRRLFSGDYLPTVWSMAFGRVGVILYGLTIALVVAFLATAWGEPGDAVSRPERDPVGADR